MADHSAPAIDRASRLRVLPNLLSADVNGNILLMSVQLGRYFGMDDIGTDVWRRLSGEPRVGELIDALTAEYAGEPSEIEREVLAFLNTLREQGLVEVEG